MLPQLGSFKKLVIVYALWSASSILAGGLFEVYFFNLGLPQNSIILANGVWFVASLLILPFLKGFESRKFMTAGSVAALLAVASLYLFPVPEAAFLFRLVLGLTQALFWVPFNTIYYEYRHGNNASLGALYYAVVPALSLVLPGLSGWLATTVGFSNLFLLAMAFFAITIIATRFMVVERRYSFDLGSVIKSVNGLKSLIFLEGFTAMSVISITLPVMLLNFVDKPLEFGYFLSLVTVFTVASSLFAGKLSDRRKERRIFLVPLAVGFALAVLLSSISQDVEVFFMGFGLINFFSRMFFPLTLALVVDNSRSLADVFVGREMMLDLGKVAGSVFGYLALSFSGFNLLLFCQGLLLLAYPIILHAKRGKLRSI